ncbi:MAG: methyl-accepting chemotaxis protein [Treponema sp.]|jgi:methyl-accepting chemotaxis protein|nr:methyl-accepting chemotaxis protein [Treponema sp.]
MKIGFLEKIGQSTRRMSIKSKFVIFSVFLFSLILIGGSIIFVISMKQLTLTNLGHDLKNEIEIERIKLEASVNGEIAIALKMATSPLIISHFMNPSDSDLRRLAFAEIVGYQYAFKSNTVFWASDVDKEFYFDENTHYTINVDSHENYWYRMTLYETEKYNFNINYNAEIKKIMLWINAPVFSSRNNPIGLVGTGIDLTNFIETIYKGYKSNASLYFFNDMGEITGAKKTSLITDKVTMEKELGDNGKNIFDAAKRLNPGDSVNFSVPGGEAAVSGVPALGWYIAAIQSAGIVDALNTNMTGVFLAMIAVIAVIFIVFFLFITGILKPLDSMVKNLEIIMTDWDLNRRINLNQHDEIGTLGEYFNKTFHQMKKLIVGIKKQTFTLSDTGDELTSYMVTAGKIIEGIDSNIQDMREQVLSQSDKVNAAAGSMERIIKGLDTLNDHIALQAQSVAQSSSAIEEMLANIQSVTQTLVKNTANISSLAESSEAGRADLQKVAADIQDIAHESEGLLQINSVMQNISSQTNLLSMNAAIEAAHAGESGRGFAVVADEIRKLAENSGVQSKTISAVLKKIKSSIDAITKSTGIVLERFGTIENEVATVSTQENQIRNAMEEQGVGSRQILEAISQLNNVTDLVKRASSEMTVESKDVLTQSNSLKQITGEVAGSMDDISGNIDEITGAINRVREISTENKENIGSLSTEVARFKVEK